MRQFCKNSASYLQAEMFKKWQFMFYFWESMKLNACNGGYNKVYNQKNAYLRVLKQYEM